LGGRNGHGALARIIHLPPGPVDADQVPAGHAGWLGLLITDGILMLEITAGRARVGWITGTGDLIRPWDLSDSPLTAEGQWRALAPTKLAVLDQGFSRRVESIPGLTRTLLERSGRTTRWLLAKSLVLSCPLIEERLLLLFALLAERWGRVTAEGVRLDLPVTHELLAILCGARRPSVTMALRSLTRQHLVSRDADGLWILRREVGVGNSDRPSCWEEYADALGLSER
jgi:hypothetical protein